MRLGRSRADNAARGSGDRAGLAGETVVPIGARTPGNCIQQKRRDRAVIFGRDEQQAVRGAHLIAEAFDGGRRRILEVLAEQRQVVDFQLFEFGIRRAELHQRLRNLLVDRAFAGRANDDPDGQSCHNTSPVTFCA
jgi:hypothetical protein